MPGACLRRGFGKRADSVIEGYVDPPSLHYGVTSPRELLRDEGPFGDHTGYYMLPERYPVLLWSSIPDILNA